MIDFDDDEKLVIYNKELIALSSQADQPRRLEKPDYQARAVSPVCGSEVGVELKIADRKITAFGFDVDACALTKTVLAVMSRAIIGKTLSDIQKAGAALEAMLEGKDLRPSGDWEALKILEPAKDYTARHNAILLPFEAVEKALKGSSKI